MIELIDAEVHAPDDDSVILNPTSLTLRERRVSVIGANGSGKSTLARLFNGLIVPSSGAVRVCSGDAPDAPCLDTRRDGAAVRRTVGFVFSDPGAQIVMPTVLEDVALSLRREHRNADRRRIAAAAVLERFGIASLADRSVHALSGGQRQLLALASVLATNPGILVADEPTTLLDLRNSRVIGDLLFGLEQQLIVVTHDLDLAARAERTIVVDDARVAFDGPPAAAIDWYRGRS